MGCGPSRSCPTGSSRGWCVGRAPPLLRRHCGRLHETTDAGFLELRSMAEDEIAMAPSRSHEETVRVFEACAFGDPVSDSIAERCDDEGEAPVAIVHPVADVAALARHGEIMHELGDRGLDRQDKITNVIPQPNDERLARHLSSGHLGLPDSCGGRDARPQRALQRGRRAQRHGWMPRGSAFAPSFPPLSGRGYVARAPLPCPQRDDAHHERVPVVTYGRSWAAPQGKGIGLLSIP